jgi:hypothetical protein
MPRKTLQERTVELEKKRQQLTTVLAHAQHDEKFSLALTDILSRAVTRPLDRSTIAELLKKTA